jgi:hypothetical protein
MKKEQIAELFEKFEQACYLYKDVDFTILRQAQYKLRTRSFSQSAQRDGRV